MLSGLQLSWICMTFMRGASDDQIHVGGVRDRCHTGHGGKPPERVSLAGGGGGGGDDDPPPGGEDAVEEAVAPGVGGLVVDVALAHLQALRHLHHDAPAASCSIERDAGNPFMAGRWPS